MMYIFTIVEGSLKITYNNVVTVLIAKKDLSIISNELYEATPRAVLFNLNGGYNEKVLDVLLSICSEDGINPFTVETFIVFAETYLGFYGSGGGGGIPEAPIDGLQYGRQDAQWTPIISGSAPVVISKLDINNLISTNSLVSGTLYQITGVQPLLYNDGTNSGTTIFLQAITTNKLATQGYGIFYNPKYNKAISGFGIWNNNMNGTFSNIVGDFDYLNKETITANNGATGLILADGFIQWVSGDWSASISITGNTSFATADVAGFVSPVYSIDQKVIWGGYSWTNTTGNVGSSTNILNLDTTNWSKDIYDEINYNKVLDLIEYDIENDWISRRCEIQSGNDVTYTLTDYNRLGFNNSAISAFMFGNKFDSNLYVGIGNNKINHAYNENINFIGSRQNGLIFNEHSFQSDSIFGKDSNQVDLIFEQSSFQYGLVFGQNSRQTQITFGIDSSQEYLIFGKNSAQVGLTFWQDSIQHDLIFMQDSNQHALTFNQNSSQSYLTIPISKSQQNIIFESGTQVNSIDLSSAILIFENFAKTIYKKPDATNRLRYYNNADTLVFAEITD